MAFFCRSGLGRRDLNRNQFVAYNLSFSVCKGCKRSPNQAATEATDRGTGKSVGASHISFKIRNTYV